MLQASALRPVRDSLGRHRLSRQGQSDLLQHAQSMFCPSYAGRTIYFVPYWTFCERLRGYLCQVLRELCLFSSVVWTPLRLGWNCHPITKERSDEQTRLTDRPLIWGPEEGIPSPLFANFVQPICSRLHPDSKI